MSGEKLALADRSKKSDRRRLHGVFDFASLPFALSSGPLLLVAWLLIAVGCAALIAAFSVVMLPHEHTATGLNPALLAHSHGPLLVDYLIHNRVSFGGALVGCGLLYHWLITHPLRQGESWAWYILALSGGVGVLSFAGYFLRGYIDPLHGLGSGLLAAALAWGLWQKRGMAGVAPAFVRFAWQKAIAVRVLLSLWAGGNLLGGGLILLVGLFPVFVAEDLAFLRTSLESFDNGPALLLPFVAHDRVGFGGALIALGIAQLGTLWGQGEDLSARLGWLTLLWLLGAATAIGIHPLVGYNSLLHLLPFLLKDGAFLIGLFVWLARFPFRVIPPNSLSPLPLPPTPPPPGGKCPIR